MTNSFVIGQQVEDTLLGEVVTVIAFEQWKGGLAVCVNNPSTPNPSNIPGLENYWVDSRNLSPVEGN